MGQGEVPRFFAFYPYEFLSDERVLAMTLEQVGAYLLLIISQWINGSIPSDIPTLARILKRTTAEMEILWAGVGPCFTEHPTEEGRLVQKRVEEEREKTIAAIERSAERQSAYRERKRLKEEARLRALRGGDGDVTQQNSEMTKPSTLISSCIHKPSKRKEDTEKWEEFKRLYPSHKFDEARACQAWLSKDGEEDAILAGLKEWAGSESWREHGGKFVNKASNFIFEEVYKLKPQGAVEPEASRYVEWDGKS